MGKSPRCLAPDYCYWLCRLWNNRNIFWAMSDGTYVFWSLNIPNRGGKKDELNERYDGGNG